MDTGVILYYILKSDRFRMDGLVMGENCQMSPTFRHAARGPAHMHGIPHIPGLDVPASGTKLSDPTCRYVHLRRSWMYRTVD